MNLNFAPTNSGLKKFWPVIKIQTVAVCCIHISTVLSNQLVICSHQMPYFPAKMHQIQFRLGLYSKPRWRSYSVPRPLAGVKGLGAPPKKLTPYCLPFRPRCYCCYCSSGLITCFFSSKTTSALPLKILALYAYA